MAGFDLIWLYSEIINRKIQLIFQFKANRIGGSILPKRNWYRPTTLCRHTSIVQFNLWFLSVATALIRWSFICIFFNRVVRSQNKSRQHTIVQSYTSVNEHWCLINTEPQTMMAELLCLLFEIANVELLDVRGYLLYLQYVTPSVDRKSFCKEQPIYNNPYLIGFVVRPQKKKK